MLPGAVVSVAVRRLPCCTQRALLGLRRTAATFARSSQWPFDSRRTLVGAAVATVFAVPFFSMSTDASHDGRAQAQAGSSEPLKEQPATQATISRLMLPDDANPAGNVHGGTILQMVDEAGWAAATKFVNQAHGPASVASLARIEKMDFLRPMHIGEVAIVEAQVTYVSEHSIEVMVTVQAENVVKGTREVTNKARTWYVAKTLPKVYTEGQSRLSLNEAREHHTRADVLRVPPLQYASADDKLAGDMRYQKQKQERMHAAGEASTPADSTATLIHVLLPSDCFLDGVAQAGTVLKLMDSAAGVASLRHTRSNVVTASLQAVDFVHPVFNGDLLEMHARPVFTSERSMDVEVKVYAQSVRQPEKRLTTTSIFTFVALDAYGRPRPIPQLTPSTAEEKARFELGQQRYMERKAERAKVKP